MTAQIAVSAEAITQGAVLAGILAGFAFIAATSEKSRATVVMYFTAGMLMLVSIWAGVLALVTANLATESRLAEIFFVTLGLGSLLFVAATANHVAELHGGVTATLCVALALAVALVGVLLVVSVLSR